MTVLNNQPILDNQNSNAELGNGSSTVALVKGFVYATLLN